MTNIKNKKKLAKKILLIGGAGYVGSAVAQYLLSKKYQIKIYDNLIYKNQFAIDLLKKKFKFSFFKGDICEINKNSNILKDIDCVILFAGIVGDPITKKYPKLSKKINELGCKKVIKAVIKAKIKSFIFISTCSNYGFINNRTNADENHPLKPISLYAKSKVKIEKYIMKIKEKNFNPTILRFATAFGFSPRMRLDLTVNEFIFDLLSKKELTVYDANTWRPYCHVIDFARLIEIIINSKKKLVSKQIFNVGSNQNNFTKKKIVSLLKKNIKNCKIFFNKDTHDQRNYKVNFNKIKNNLKFKTKYNLKDSIPNLIRQINNIKYKNKILFGNYSI
jgi:nucleoside-diphosphate-sugar epimerase